MTPDEFIRTYETSTRSHGLERTLSLIDADAVYWLSDGTSHQGKSAIERAIRHNFGTIKNEDYRISDIQWVAQSADVAVCIYRFDWSGVIADSAALGAGRGTSVLIK